MHCDRPLKTTVFHICEQNDPISQGTQGNIKVSSKNQNWINLLPVIGGIKAAFQTQTEGRVKFGSLDHGNSAEDLTLLFKSSLSLNSDRASRAAKSLRLKSLLCPSQQRALQISAAYTPYEITISCENVEEALLL